MLVHARAEDVKAHARWLGIDLDSRLDDGSLLLLRYRTDFVNAASHAVCSDDIVDDLDRLIAPHRPTRVVIDTFAPFLLAPPPVAPVAVALVELLRRSGATSLLTFSEDVECGYDRTLEPLMSEAAAVIRLKREDEDVRRAELLNLRYRAPESMTARFVIRQGTGIAVEHPLRLERLALRVP
jgi:KaiC/GvpD/RAD55 family RecA-like ATPase